jgi:hypothetical protein
VQTALVSGQGQVIFALPEPRKRIAQTNAPEMAAPDGSDYTLTELYDDFEEAEKGEEQEDTDLSALAKRVALSTVLRMVGILLLLIIHHLL